MSRSVRSYMYEGVGRFTVATRKRQLRRNATHMPHAGKIAIGATLAVGILGFGALAARSRGGSGE